MCNFYRGNWKKIVAGLLLTAFLFGIFFLRIFNIDGKMSLAIGSPGDSFLISEGSFLVRKTFSKNEQIEKIGWLSDIHADRFKRRTVDSGTLYPRQYQDYLPKVFDAMKQQGIQIVIATGDNTNSGDDNYARELAKIAQEKRMQVIWVRGNHDNDEVMKILGGENRETYFFVDTKNTRIIALDDVQGDGGYQGNIDAKQLEWLKEALKTDKQVVVAMHIPIFEGSAAFDAQQFLQGGEFTQIGDLLPRYEQLEQILRASGKVKMVLAGHLHVPWQRQYDGLNYFGQAALTREGYTGAYGIIEVEKSKVDYLFAK
ncbi:MAG: metallophosphoesterase [Candidatus Moraniibacteriota bacterium]